MCTCICKKTTQTKHKTKKHTQTTHTHIYIYICITYKTISIISIRAFTKFNHVPYRRIIQKEMRRIAPIAPFVKGKMVDVNLQIRAQW